MSGFLAFIIPMSGGPVDPGFGVPGWPAHPIAPGGERPTHPIAPGGERPTHPIAPGGKPPTIWPSPGHPAHPIAPGGEPPGIWGGGNEPFPTPPIVLPPGTEKPPPGIWSEPILPPGIWPSPGHPAHPIAPGGQPPSEPPLGFWGGVAPPQIWGDPIMPAEPPQIIDWYAGWSEDSGWVIVGVPNVPAPTPSKK
jgi:hypothetical protein